ncbi:MAG: LPXTG cell wall anchor domain-containing protein [Ilumatobacteraceae bacterium]
MSQAVVKCSVGGAIAVLAVLASPTLPAMASSAAGATVCTTEPYAWFGQKTLAPGESFVAAEVSPAEAGAQLIVEGVDTSPSAVAVRVGDMPATNGSAVAGGAITATNDGADPLTVLSIALNISRCHQVASEAVVPAAQPAVAAVDGPAVVRVAGPAPAAPPAAVVGPAAVPFTVDLPTTGSTSASLVLGAFGATALGIALLALSRRRGPASSLPTRH